MSAAGHECSCVDDAVHPALVAHGLQPGNGHWL